MSETARSMRIGVVGIVVVSLFASLFVRLYYLQILRDTTLEEVRGAPRFKEIAYQGTRGRILDRNGRVLVDNRESIVVTMDRNRFAEVEDQEGLKRRLAEALTERGVQIKVTDIAERLEDPRYDPFKPVPIAEDVGPELETYLLERLFEFPSVDVVRTQVRTYPYGTLAAHVLGYTGSISAEELAARPKDRSREAKPYEAGDDIGKAGVEKVFESELRATPGVRDIEVDARNVEVGTRSVTPSQPGRDLQLTIDLALQQKVEQLLPAALLEARAQKKRDPADPDYRAPAGAVVVLDARSSEVLAMASFPTYNPAEFIGGISTYRFAELQDPAAFNPLFNRAIQAGYSPGSTFKPFTAVAALKTGVVTAEETIRDIGFWEVENCTESCYFQNAGRTPWGIVDLRRAMTVSSDVYFYRIGERLWVDQATYGKTAIQDVSRRFGLGSATGVQLPDEFDGLIADPELRRQRHEDNPEAFPNGIWLTGDNVNLSIGQGEMLVTPLQLANAYAALANGGALHAPSVAKGLLDHDSGAVVSTFQPRKLAQVDLPEAVRQPLLDGLEGVVDNDEGTAYGAFDGFPVASFKIAGKTGTAEVNNRADSALFVSFGPLPNPRYVVMAILEEAGFASVTAAPLVRKIYEQLDEVRPLLPVEEAASPSVTTTAPGAGATTTTGATDGDQTGATVAPGASAPAANAPAPNAPAPTAGTVPLRLVPTASTSPAQASARASPSGGSG